MRRSTTFSTAMTLALLTLAPLGGAQWSAYGSFEPSTSYDRDPTWMWPDAPGVPGRIYLNVVTGSQQVTSNGEPFVNANVGLLQTQFETAGAEFHHAFFGVWLDCNGDGYIGMAETAMREYDSDLLLDDTVCPFTTGPGVRWTPGAHNYRGIVSELVPIGRDTNTSADARIYVDDDARVWGDFHRPDERPTHRSCALRPLPRGTITNTGGAMNYIDCRQDILGAWNRAAAALDMQDLAFADEDDARSGPLGHIPLAGHDSSENAAVRVSDCSGESDVHVGDTLNDTPLGPSAPPGVQNTRITGVDPQTGDLSDPTLSGQVNQTSEEFVGDCDTSNDFGHDLAGGFGQFAIESDFNGVDPNNKLEADWNFGFTTVARGPTHLALIPGGYSGPAGVPGDGGIAIGGSRWTSDSTYLSKPGFGTVRADLERGTVDLASAYWLTFYAHVGRTTLDRALALPGASGEYGSWHCNGAESGIHQGWNCDASLWYANPDGTFVPDPEGELARPGWAYELRDVDCYDGRIGATGMGIQPAFYGDLPCE